MQNEDNITEAVKLIREAKDILEFNIGTGDVLPGLECLDKAISLLTGQPIEDEEDIEIVFAKQAGVSLEEYRKQCEQLD